MNGKLLPAGRAGLPLNGPGSLFITVEDYAPLPEASFSGGVALAGLEYQRPLPEAKSLMYGPAVHAALSRQDPDIFEVIYYWNGELREAATSNVFLVKDGRLATPHAGILPGITRQTVLELARGNYPVEERTVGYAELFEADEAFLTSTNKDVLPVVKVDDKPIGSGQPGEISLALLRAYRSALRRQNR